MKTSVLSINVGSSSIKFALYQKTVLQFHGKIEGIGQSDVHFVFKRTTGQQQTIDKIPITDHASAALFLIDWLEEQEEYHSKMAIGHRVVHGMRHHEPQRITKKLIQELHGLEQYAPDHLPPELQLIELFQQRYPHVDQVACFDTSFHCTMPRIAKLLPIPQRYAAKGLERYGFHGLSYSYLMEELSHLAGPTNAQKRVILAHLGNGASMAAVHKGKSIDTSMGFTPTAGLIMGSRSGDLDPGVANYLERTEQMTGAQFYRMLNKESGLLGISETSSDMSDLLLREKNDLRAAEAVALFCYQTKKWIGAYAAALGGLDTLVFSGGIGENAPLIRERICTGLEFLGIDLDEVNNKKNDGVISSQKSRVIVRVIPTNEELMIARSVTRILAL